MLTDETRLPRCILVNTVLPHLDAYSLVCLSDASRECRRVVHEEIPRGRWREIDLSGSGITDEQLCAFLRNINARDNTRLISLVGCLNIRGRGLEPLRGSNVLEDVDLRVLGSRVPGSPVRAPRGAETKHGPSGLNEEFVSQILFSMLPLQRELRDGTRVLSLRRVAVRPWLPVVIRGYRGYSDTFRRFLHHHESLKRFLPLEDPGQYTSHSCSYCHVKNVKGEEMKCAVCWKYYCTACALPPECSECDNRKCQWCSNVMECGGCRKRSCASHGYECCGGCERAFCRDCHEKELEFCVVCNEYYCTEACHRRAHG